MCLGWNVSCGRPLPDLHATLETVELPQTPVRNQGRFGVCWAYGTIGLVEAEFKREQGLDIDLSEEALVFYHMAEGMEALFKTLSVSELLTVLSKQALPEGWNTRITPDYETPLAKGEPRQRDGLDLIQTYGLVPEEVWSFKVSDETAKQKLFQAIVKNTRRLLQGSRPLASYSLQEIMEQVLVGEGAFPSVPPSQFEYRGEIWDSREFVRSKLRFQPDDFGVFNSQSDADYPQLVALLKRALHRGYSVPLAFPINVDRFEGDRLTGAAIRDPNDWISFARDGGHLVLVKDYVNQGMSMGALSTQQQDIELKRPSEDLEFIVFKNSWGVGAKFNEAGLPLATSTDGHYKMDKSYLKGAMRVPALTKIKYNNVQIVVPRSMLAP
jgi:hypothetical protein